MFNSKIFTTEEALAIHEEFEKKCQGLKEHISEEELKEIRDKAFREMVQNKYRKLYVQKFELETLGESLSNLKKELESDALAIKKNKAEQHHNSYIFFTINPRPDVKLEDFYHRLQKIESKTCFVSVLWCLEQRGTNKKELGKGMHAHILVERNLNYKPTKLVTNMKQSFSKFCDVEHKNLFTAQKISSNWAKDKAEYITGVKTGDGKDIKQQMDELWRKRNNLKTHYGNLTL